MLCKNLQEGAAAGGRIEYSDLRKSFIDAIELFVWDGGEFSMKQCVYVVAIEVELEPDPRFKSATP